MTEAQEGGRNLMSKSSCRSEAEDRWGTGDRDNVSAGCTGMEAHGRLGCH